MKNILFKIKQFFFSILYKNEKQKIEELRHWYSVLEDIPNFKENGRTDFNAFRSMRKLHVFTKGKSSEIIHGLVKSPKIGGLNLFSGVLGLKNPLELNEALSSLKENGFYVFPNKLPQEQVLKILDFSIKNNCTCRGKKDNTPNSISGGDFLNQEHNYPRCDFNFNDIFNCKETKELIFDENLLSFAQEYLNCLPLFDLTALWWSRPSDRNFDSEAAQLFHFDLDRPKFLKFFFYITDVDAFNGPHTYVKGSHKKWKDLVFRDGRFDDETVQRNCGPKEIIEITGAAGTIVAVDTKGLHKGKKLIDGNRLIFQIEFASSLFGQNYEKIEIQDSLENFTKNSLVYKEFFKIKK